MAGSWEYPEVVIAVLTRETVSMRWAMSLKALNVPKNTVLLPVSGLPFDHARNHAANIALENHAEYLFFIDDDVLCPAETYNRLKSHQKPVVSGVYFRRQEPLCPVMRRWRNGVLEWVNTMEVPQMMEVDVVGAGCLLIHTSVLRTLMPRPFRWDVDNEAVPENERCSEDFSFCLRVKRQLGIPILVDTAVQCEHVGMATSRLIVDQGQMKYEFRPL